MDVDERPLLGRDAELRELAGVLADAAQHRSRVVLVTGEAGIDVLPVDHPFFRFCRLVG